MGMGIRLAPAARVARLQRGLGTRGHHLAAASAFSSPKQTPLKVLFFGTDEFSVKTLEALHDEKNAGGIVSEVAVCHLPMRSLVSAVHKLAKKRDIPLIEWPPNPRGIAEDGFNIGVVASFGKLIPRTVIDAFSSGVLNVHASLLPRWRGASPIPHAIMEGDAKTGVSIMEIEPLHFDRGDVLATRGYSIPASSSRVEVTRDLAIVGAELMVEVLGNLDGYRKNKWTQDEEKATYAPRIDAHHFRLDFAAQSASTIANRYRALGDLGKFRAIWEPTNVLVRCTDLVRSSEVSKFELSVRHPEAEAGDVVAVRGAKNERLVCVKTASGEWVGFRTFYYGTKKAMGAKEFISGFMKKSGTSRPRFVAE